MNKTKMGFNVGMMAALVYLVCDFAGYTIAMLLAGYVLLCEEDHWLKKSALKGILIMIGLSVASTVINLIPNVISIPLDLINIFGFNLNVYFLHEIANLLYSVVSLAETVLLIFLAVKSVNKQEVKVPVIDKIVDMFYED